ncbi:MAG TPA: response regulator [Bacteroidales bacterium]|nr:response regulator [Bacteroidales bacterium]
MVQKKKIMLIDDSSTNNILYESILSEEGFEVTVVSNPLLAIQNIKSEKPDLIILDLRMPVLDGFQIMEKIRGDKEISSIPIIVLSAENSREAEKKSYDLGAALYLSKPIGIDDIIQIVSKHMSATA